MKYLIYFISILLLAGLNIGVFSNFKIAGQIPNFLFLFALCFALQKDDFDFFFVALICGIFVDFFAVGFLGSFSLAFLIVCLAVHLFANNVAFVEFNWKSLTLLMLASLIALNLIAWIYSFVLYKFNWIDFQPAFGTVVKATIPQFFYNLVFFYPVIVFVNFIKRQTENFYIRRRGVIS